MQAQLQERWSAQLHPLNIPSSITDKWFDTIVQRYSEPQRHYHTLSHVYNLFILFDEYLHLLKNPLVCAQAIWFHEYVFVGV